MPRTARTISQSGIYHIMLRGINQQQIFKDYEDSDKYLQILAKCKTICGFELYAYCLMGNHIHLLIKAAGEPPELVFKRIGARFVYWYNLKYKRTGHLFQDRFRSEAVENEEYFLTVVRYIHQNPIKAGICERAEDYFFSSYKDYISHENSSFVDREAVLSLISLDDFIAFHNERNTDNCLEMQEKIIKRVTDEEAKRIIVKCTKCKGEADFKELDAELRSKCILKLRENGLSIRQISRLLGVSYEAARTRSKDS